MNMALLALKEFLRNDALCKKLVQRIAEDFCVQYEYPQNTVTVDQLKDFFRCMQRGMEYACGQPWGKTALPDALIIKSVFCVPGQESPEVFHTHRTPEEFQLWINHLIIARTIDHSAHGNLERVPGIPHLLFSARDALTLTTVSQCFLTSSLRTAQLFTKDEYLRIMQDAIKTLRIRIQYG